MRWFDEKSLFNFVFFSHVFAVFDKNHDGTIDFPEFLLAVAADSPSDLDGHLQYVFEMCDVSGDGEMDVNELATFLSASVTKKKKRNFLFNFKSKSICFQLTVMNKNVNAEMPDPKTLAIGVFNTLGITNGKRITKKQFVEG